MHLILRGAQVRHLCRVAAIVILLCTIAIRAESVNLTTATRTLDPLGGSVTFEVRIQYEGSYGFSFSLEAPAGWRFVSTTFRPLGPISQVPALYDQGQLRWFDVFERTAPAAFSFVLSYPANSPPVSITPSVVLNTRTGSTIGLGTFSFPVVASFVGAPVVLGSSASSGGPRENARLTNLSARAQIGGTAGLLIAGFVVDGGESLPVLIRAVGPSLAGFGVSGSAFTALQLYKNGQPDAANTGWDSGANASAIERTAQRLGAFALPPVSRDSALLVTLTRGNYTAIVTGGDGIALIEVYDASTGPSARLTNLAARAIAGTGDATLTAGFVVEGRMRVLTRGIGPALAAFGVATAMSDPILTIKGGIAANNDNWGGGINGSITNVAEIAAASASVGAFPLSPQSKDAALLLDLISGQYTAQIEFRESDRGGTGLVEIYEVP